MKTQESILLPMLTSFIRYFVNRCRTQTGKMKQNFIWILTGLMFIGLLGLPSMSFAIEGTWRRKANMPIARSALSTAVVNDKIYAIGGAIGADVSSKVEEYDVATDIWTKKAEMLTPRFNCFRHSQIGGV